MIFRADYTGKGQYGVTVSGPAQAIASITSLRHLRRSQKTRACRGELCAGLHGVVDDQDADGFAGCQGFENGGQFQAAGRTGWCIINFKMRGGGYHPGSHNSAIGSGS
jgi:hypothetical protein